MSLEYYRIKRLGDLARGARRARGLAALERVPPAVLAADQAARVDALVRHAAAHAPYWREQAAGLVGRAPIPLAALPILDKATLAARGPDLFCDRRLAAADLLAGLADASGDELALGRYRIIATSGSSGRRTVFAYDREGWAGIVAQFLRASALLGVHPRVPRLRIAAIGGASPSHMSRRIAQTISLGLHRVLSLPVTMPLDQLVTELNAFRPEYVNAYPSLAVLLAEEQRAGRLRIVPRRFSTTSELRTPEMTARIAEAFGVRPYDLYGSTEGLWGADCEHHAGVHLFEHASVVENVDAAGRPVPDGEAGARVLVTNLANRVQPLIRVEVTDVMVLDSAPCRCGRTLRRARRLEGRASDVIRLPGPAGVLVPVLPAQFSLLTADRDVREFQVVQAGERVRVLVVLRPEAAEADAVARLQGVVARRLAAAGVARPEVEIVLRDRLERSAGGKLKLVVADG
jgi:phenylacetate-CoA ligase